MAAQGVELNEIECQPVDPVTSNKYVLPFKNKIQN